MIPASTRCQKVATFVCETVEPTTRPSLWLARGVLAISITSNPMPVNGTPITTYPNATHQPGTILEAQALERAQAALCIHAVRLFAQDTLPRPQRVDYFSL
jgi:hypothetical protein